MNTTRFLLVTALAATVALPAMAQTGGGGSSSMGGSTSPDNGMTGQGTGMPGNSGEMRGGTDAGSTGRPAEMQGGSGMTGTMSNDRDMNNRGSTGDSGPNNTMRGTGSMGNTTGTSTSPTGYDNSYSGGQRVDPNSIYTDDTSSTMGNRKSAHPRKSARHSRYDTTTRRTNASGMPTGPSSPSGTREGGQGTAEDH